MSEEQLRELHEAQQAQLQRDYEARIQNLQATVSELRTTGAPSEASAREYEADQLRQAQRLSIGDRRRQGSPRAPTSDSVDEDQLAAELESLREKHDRELANLRASHNREMGQLQERHAALRDPVGALLSSTGCGQYRQKFAEQDIVSKADFDMLRMEDLLEVGLEQREADALAAALGI